MKILIVDDIKGWRDYHASAIYNLFSDAEIQLAESAKEGYDKLIENNDAPFDIILTDMQMEEDFEPKYAGEWFIEQIQNFQDYSKTKIVIISAAYNINTIAEHYNLQYIRKSTAMNFPNVYSILKE